jgi:hypothetical protein
MTGFQVGGMNHFPAEAMLFIPLYFFSPLLAQIFLALPNGLQSNCRFEAAVHKHHSPRFSKCIFYFGEMFTTETQGHRVKASSVTLCLCGERTLSLHLSIKKFVRNSVR